MCVFECVRKTSINTTVYITALALVILPQDYIIIKSNFEKSIKLRYDSEWQKDWSKPLMSTGIG